MIPKDVLRILSPLETVFYDRIKVDLGMLDGQKTYFLGFC